MSGSTRYAVDRDVVAALLTEWGEPRYRGDQVWDALYRTMTPLESATALPKPLRARLGDALPLALSPLTESRSRDTLTTKWLWAAGDDGAQVEAVLMRSPRRASVCVSSQAGCAMDCSFCATGQAGFDRHLHAGEIVEQVVRAAQSSPQPVTNVVYMGMGEPLANYDEVWSSVERLHRDVGISARRITVSTVGVVPGMRRLATEALPITLAVSLHAADDELRAQLVPLNRRYPITEVLDAAAEVAGARGRRVTFEYACIAGVNDTPQQLDALGRLLGSWPGVGGAHVNLIPLNATSAYGGRSSNRRHLRALALRLAGHGVHATVRRTRGTDIDAACGQLRARDPRRDRAVDHNGPVSERRFLNQFQPQTLVIGTMLCYLDAIFGFLFGMVSTSVVLALLTIAGLAIGGYGIANEKKWGYAVAVGAAVLQVIMLIAVAGSDVLGFPLVLNLVFDGALVALLLHPQSRDYQRIWFK